MIMLSIIVDFPALLTLSSLSTALEGELPFADLCLDAMFPSLGVQINLIFEYPPVRHPICSCSVISILLGIFL